MFVPSFTYVATAEALANWCYASTVDVDADTFNIDVNSLKRAISDAEGAGLVPKVVIPVDLFGQPATLMPLTIAQAANLKS